MGYNTTFTGAIEINPPLPQEKIYYLNRLLSTRRMDRDPRTLATFFDPLREAVNLPIGRSGQYYVNAGGYAGQDRDCSIINYNDPPAEQPFFWCHYAINDNGSTLQWDYSEKFYEYTEWLHYLVEHFFAPWGHVLHGALAFQGDDQDDYGWVVCLHNTVSEIREKKEIPIALRSELATPLNVEGNYCNLFTKAESCPLTCSYAQLPVGVAHACELMFPACDLTEKPITEPVKPSLVERLKQLIPILYL